MGRYRKDPWYEKVLVGFALAVLVVALVFVLAAASAGISAVLIMLAFNHGVIPLLAAFGFVATKIGFWTSFWFGLFIGVLGGLVKGSKVDTSSNA